MDRVGGGMTEPTDGGMTEPTDLTCMGSHETGPCAHPRHNPETGKHDKGPAVESRVIDLMEALRKALRRNQRARWMEVVSPMYRTYDTGWPPVDPPEDVVDYALVFTHSKERARVLAVRWWRRMHGYHGYRFETVMNGENPFVGLTVNDIPEAELGVDRS